MGNTATSKLTAGWREMNGCRITGTGIMSALTEKKYTGAHMIAGVDYLFDSNGILQEDQTEVPDGTVPVTIYNCTTSEPVAMTVRFTESDGKIYCMADGSPVSDRWVKAGRQLVFDG